MKLGRIFRMMLLVTTGGVVFESTTSCTTELINSLSTTLADSLNSAIDSGITTYVNQLLAG